VSLYDTLRSSAGNRSLQQLAITNYFDRNAKTAYISVPGEKEVFSPKFFLANELETTVVLSFLHQNESSMERAKNGETLLINASPVFGIPTAALLLPFRDFGTENLMIIIFSTETIQSMVQTENVNGTRVVAFDGSLLGHSDFELVKTGVNLNTDPLVSQMMSSTMDNSQLQYKNEEGTKFIGAFRKVSLGQFGVVTTIPYDVVNRAALNIARQALYITAIVLLFSVLAIWFFSRRVSRPIYSLVEASNRIRNGEFELDLQRTSQDEIGLLTESFVHMGQGLAERERVKETFGKFVNPQIAELALKGDLQLGGTRRNATIFFSDIRSFTAISENMAPEAVVEFLNEYMTLMVDCIEKTGGVVDKFIGDAIMAVWGAPITAGSEKEDALLAVRSMLMMRDALREFNRGRGSKDKPSIQIGCGVNTGPCLAGQIGSEKRMEYTVIGEAVNLASRIEALNKPFATDILISESTYNLVKEVVQVELMPSVRVKGKTAPLNIYAVLSMTGYEGPSSVKALREFLGIKPPSQEINAEQKEVKYEVFEK
jgi:adenylate cyclase